MSLVSGRGIVGGQIDLTRARESNGSADLGGLWVLLGGCVWFVNTVFALRSLMLTKVGFEPVFLMYY